MPEAAARGCALHYEITDLTPPWISAPETILFHHGLGSTSGIWAQWLPVLADRFQIIRFDMRGHGKSNVPQADLSVTLDLLTDDVFAVADAAAANRFHLVGESIGGTIALNAALLHQARVLSVTVSNGAHLGGSIESVRDWREIIDRSGMAGWSKQMMHRRFFDGAISADMWQWYEREQANTSPDFLLAALAALVATDLAPRLKGVHVPVMLMHGDSSPFVSVQVMADLKARLPRCRLQVFAHARHGLPFSHARQCAETLRHFLERPC
jgi:pimeloyl-ACP methyl ester carboxylesterase